MKECKFCGYNFVASRKDAKYCSRKCAGKARRNQVKKECEYCCCEFYVVASKKDVAKYCSMECRLADIDRVAVRCITCGKTHYAEPHIAKKRKLCSVRCKNKYLQNRITLVCQICGVTFDVKRSHRKSRKYCSMKCLGKSKSKTNKPTNKQLRHLIYMMKMKDVAEIFDCSTTTIGNWCKAARIAIPKKNERKIYKRMIDEERKRRYKIDGRKEE